MTVPNPSMQRTPLPARLLRQRLTALVDALPAASSGDVESVHRARVASRRLREVLPVLSEAAASPHLARAGKDVRRITRALGPIRELLFQGMVRVFYVKNATEEAIEHHQAIFDCVRARKPEAARRAMQAHLDQFERVLRLANRMGVSRPNQDERLVRSIGRK